MAGVCILSLRAPRQKAVVRARPSLPDNSFLCLILFWLLTCDQPEPDADVAMAWRVHEAEG